MTADRSANPKAPEPRPALPQAQAPEWRRTAPVVAALVLVVVGGVLGWAGRRQLAASIHMTTTALDRVPNILGDWQGEPLKLDARIVEAAGVNGSWLRRYTHKPTGRVVSVLVVWGRTEPILNHTPEVCYPASGYRMAGSPKQLTFEGATFNSANFSNRSAPVPMLIHVLWSWNMSGKWETPDRPDLIFAHSPSLAKIYFVFESGEGQLESGGETGDLVRTMMSEINKVLPTQR